MFYWRMIHPTMRNVRAPVARFSNCSSADVSARFRNIVSKAVFEFHGRSYASSSVASQCTTLFKARKILTRNERRSLVESFVTRYRATNGGKFPTLDAIRKEVGGNYYVLRDIYQELKLESKTPSVGTARVRSVQVEAGNDSSVATNEAKTDDGRSRSLSRHSRSSSNVIVGLCSPAGGPDVVETETDQKRDPVDLRGSDNSNHLSDTPVIVVLDDELRNKEMEKVSQNHVESKGDSFNHLPDNSQRNVVSDACLETADPGPEEEPKMSVNFKTNDGGEKVKEETRTTHQVAENPNEKIKTINPMALGGQESKQDHIAEPESVDNASLEAETRARGVSGRGVVIADEQTRRQGSVWGNIKSLAEGIMNFWRKG